MRLFTRSPAVAGLWLLLTLSARPQALPEPGPVISEILAKHPTVRRAELMVEAAEASLSGSHLQPNPTLTLSATAGDAGEDSNALTQVFEISGQPRIRKEQALARLESARLQLRAARREVAAAVTSGWLELWESRQLAMMAQLRLQLMEEMRRVGKRRYEVGEIPQNESLRVELAAAEAEAGWQRAQAGYLSAQRSLSVLGELVPGLASAPPFHPEALPTSTEGEQGLFQAPSLVPESATWTLEEVLGAAGGQLEVASLREEQRASVLGTELLAKERAPQLGVSLYRSRFFGNDIEQGAQLSISWPIFDWGGIDARRRAQRAEAEAQLAEIDERVLRVRQQAADVWTRWQAARSVRDILTQQAERYEELAREARIGYDLGLLTLTDVLQTETAFRQAGVELIQAQAEVFRLELNLLQQTNLPWPSHLLEEQ